MTESESAARPDSFVEDYVPALLARASRLLSGGFHEVVRANGLSISEWRVLATLADGPPISIGRLAELSVTKQPTVTRMLERMQSKGQVERVASDSDRRVTLVRITPHGRHTVAKLIVLARQHQQQVLDALGSQRAEQLKLALRQIIALHRGASIGDRAAAADTDDRA